MFPVPSCAASEVARAAKGLIPLLLSLENHPPGIFLSPSEKERSCTKRVFNVRNIPAPRSANIRILSVIKVFILSI